MLINQSISRTLIFLTFLVFSACQDAPFSLRPAFYHWQSNIEITPEEYDFVAETGARRIYARIFDLAWGGDGPIPLARVLVDTLDLDVDEMVPVIYCTERTFRNIRADGVDTLADKVIEVLHQYIPDCFSNKKINEIQFDCDWASKSQAEYFLFLEKIKSKIPRHISLSVTLRLHQFKNPQQTGVPPCDRVMLMLYNTGAVKDFEEENSILSIKDAKKYLHGAAPYPLPLDIALPVFDWMLLFRDELLLKIIYPPQLNSLSDTAFFKKIDATHWTVQQAVQYSGHYLHPNDVLRLEQSQKETLTAVHALALPILGESGAHHLAFYHLDTVLLQQYNAAFLRALAP